MTSGTPWSVKGIDPKAREVAKDLARRSGMTLGEWLNRMILEDDAPEEITSQDYFGDRPQRSERGYLEAPRAPVVEFPIGRYEAPQHPGDEMGRVAMALDRLSGKIDRGGEPRRTPEAQAADSVMREAMARIEAAERETVAVAARFEGAVQEAKEENTRLAERLRRIEAEAAGPRSAEALRSLEAALGKVANHLYEGESRTRETIAAMEQRIDQLLSSGIGDPASLIEEVVNRVDERLTDAETRTSEALVNLGQAFADLDERIGAAEKAVGPEVERKIESLAATLSQRVDKVRGAIAHELKAAHEARLQQMERRLGEVAESVRRAEQGSGDAIEKMGREVLGIADTLNRQVQAAEHRSADAIEQVGGEVARIAQAMEARLGRSESTHAEALEKLGVEIGRITDRLTERIGSSERRAAQAIDDVGEQVARVSERINQRQDRAAEDLAERIRLSEERTARLLDEAREKIDRSLADSHRRMGEQALAAVSAPLAAAPAPRVVQSAPVEAHDPFRELAPAPTIDPLALQAFAASEPEANPFIPPAMAGPQDAHDPFADDEAVAAAAEFPQTARTPVFDADDFEAADGFDPATRATFDVETAEVLPAAETVEAAVEEAAAGGDLDKTIIDEPPLPEPVIEDRPAAAAAEAEDIVPPPPERPLTTREIIEQARLAARSASASPAEQKRAKGGAKIEKLPRPTAGKSLFSGLTLRKRAAGGSSLQTALLVAGGAAFLSISSAGFFLADGEPGGATPQRVADALAVFESDKAGEIQTGEADTTPNLANGEARAAVAIAPTMTGPLPSGPDAAALAGAYASAVQAIEAGQAGGLDQLRKAANLGHSPAQFYLAKLYAEGGAGLKKDPVEARRWTQRAAEGGNRAAMHNLGIAMAEGQGGPKNATMAAQWFRRAADLGLVDSQYNLGVLYEQGRGVSQNAAEAYKWYLVAARNRDDEALKNAARVRAGLSAEARSVAEQAAQAFRPTAPNPSSTLAAAPVSSASDIALAQRALSRLDYYQGPTDGVSSPALTMAIAAYQRERGFAATGVLDPATLSRLQVFTQ